MTSILCQINDIGFTSKPTDIKFYGRLRDKMIQKPWSNVNEEDFVRRVTEEGTAFYGCLFNGHDLLDTAEGRQRNCWRAQSIIGVDIDGCDQDALAMAAYYSNLGLQPWLVYNTFSNGANGLHSYRLLWKVEIDHNVSYEQWADVIKRMSTLTRYGDKHARDCSRLWQGSLEGPAFWMRNATPLPYKKLVKRLHKIR